MPRPRPVDPTSQPATLTRREREVLEWTAHGKTAPEAATILGVSADTVGFHLKNSCRKLDANNKTKAAAIAIERGLITLGQRSNVPAVLGPQRRAARVGSVRHASRRGHLRRSRSGGVDRLDRLEVEIERLLNAMRTMDGDWDIPRRTLLLVRMRIDEIRRS